jgi:GT2 family glycosyltransferase
MEAYPLRIAAFFCVMLPREVYESIGGLDEQFVPGFFEDDDYCLRLGQAGYRIACAEDVFVYHELSASFDQLALAKRAAIFERNKALFEAKWGPWIPHQYRPNLPRLN